MTREDLEKLNGNASWKAAFDTALVQAEIIHGTGSANALLYASTAADLACIPEAVASKAATAEAARIEEIVARVRANPATKADATLDPQAKAAAGWAKAFGSDASTGDDEKEPAGRMMDEASSIQPEASAASSGWKKAFGSGETP